MTRAHAAVARLDEASARYKSGRYESAGVWALFSGGHDSLAAALVTSQAKDFRACVHIDTGIGIPETQEFVRETCREQGWPLLVYRAVDCGQNYDELAMQFGFPGPGAHFRMYIRLKERALFQFVREHKRHWHDRLILSTGARSSESKRRMGHVEPERRDGVKVWVNAIHDWKKFDCHDYIEQRGAKRNPVVDLLHMSGECLCGSFAEPGELKEITLWYPHVGARIRDLEAKVEASGIKACKWGMRPPKGHRKGDRDASGRRRVSEMCQQCELAL
jgi:3'-phosphoadenosine 5'-phosphosulfate sulfotransferase (PAPS reductase)/FAD synthetase